MSIASCRREAWSPSARADGATPLPCCCAVRRRRRASFQRPVAAPKATKESSYWDRASLDAPPIIPIPDKWYLRCVTVGRQAGEAFTGACMRGVLPWTH